MSQLRGTTLVLDTVAARRPIISGVGATRTLNQNESGSVCLFDRVSGSVYTLPTGAVPGTYFDFIVTTTVTSNSYKVITGAGTELLIGSYRNVDTDTSDATASFRANGTTHVSINMFGAATGGIVGTQLRFTCVSATQWAVQGVVHGSAVVLTAFAAS